MDALFTSAFRALRSLLAPGMLGIFFLSLIATIAALLGFVVFTTAMFGLVSTHAQGAAASLLPWLGSVGAIVIAWFLFPGIMPVIVSFFDNRIADIIEQRDYPAQPVQTPAFWPEMLHDIRFSCLTILLNIVVLPLYLLPVAGLILFYGLNGYLLGREFFMMVARRHCPVDEAETLRKRHGRTVLMAGVALTMLATIPIVNLFAPFWGIAVMVHLYHQLTATPDSQLLPPA